MKQAFNPYLPFWETVPDGEPHVFGDRVYVYGSHDRRGGEDYCLEDYVCWSAPINDLAEWKYEGVIFRKNQDPLNPKGDHPLFAPDACQGPDGRYYLYYCVNGFNIISVAVSDSPAGPFEFYAHVKRPDGTVPEVGLKFDPAILVEESGNYLYYGFCPKVRFPGMENDILPGLVMVKLDDDMHTVISAPVVIANGPETSEGTSFAEHPAFEASSIRHIGDWYYFVYSSIEGHELCYAMGKSPEGPFEYKGILVSNADLGFEGNKEPTNYWGNNHGGLEQIGDATYIFWHRQTHGTEYSRQGCADEVHILPDGTIPQVEITSFGLNGSPLVAAEMYSTHIACHLTGPNINDKSYYSQAVGYGGHVISHSPNEENGLVIPEEMPFITEEKCDSGEKGLKPFIYNMRAEAVAGFKYFEFAGEGTVKLELRGKGLIKILSDGFNVGSAKELVSLKVDSKDWKMYDALFEPLQGIHSIFVKVEDGCIDFAAIGFTR